MKGEEGKEKEGRGENLRVHDQKKQSPVAVLIWMGV